MAERLGVALYSSVGRHGMTLPPGTFGVSARPSVTDVGHSLGTPINPYRRTGVSQTVPESVLSSDVTPLSGDPNRCYARPTLNDTETKEGHRWLHQRKRSGNWIDIAESDEIPSDIVGWERSVLHMFQLAFAPEIRKRLSAGELGHDFFLSAAQLIQPEDGGKTVRLNEEVRGIALVRASREVHNGETGIRLGYARSY